MHDGFGRCVEVNIRVHASAALHLGRPSDTLQLLDSRSLFRSRHNYNDKYCCRAVWNRIPVFQLVAEKGKEESKYDKENDGVVVE